MGTIRKNRRYSKKRTQIWSEYNNALSEWTEGLNIKQPCLPEYASNNSHMYYLVFKNINDRIFFISELKRHNINSVFHYQSLNKSPFYLKDNVVEDLYFSDFYSDCLVRLPLYYELETTTISNVINNIKHI